VVLVICVFPNESTLCVFEQTVFVNDKRLIFILRYAVEQNCVVTRENGDVNWIVRILICGQLETTKVSGKDGREAESSCIFDGGISQGHVLPFRDDLHPNGFGKTVSHVCDAVIRVALGAANLTHL
jgi:hypothetical protein